MVTILVLQQPLSHGSSPRLQDFMVAPRVVVVLGGVGQHPPYFVSLQGVLPDGHEDPDFTIVICCNGAVVVRGLQQPSPVEQANFGYMQGALVVVLVVDVVVRSQQLFPG